MANDELRWKAVLAQDASQDQAFVYGVMTTGVYCRPTCSSRRPLRKNVRFFSTPADAERAGLRACKRCRPKARSADTPLAETIRVLAREIDANPEQPLKLGDLARRAGYSAFYFQRSFKAAVGSSPKEYQVAARLRRLKSELRTDAPIADAIYQAGFGSPSRVYEKIDAQLGMTPGAYRRGGAGVHIAHASARTPLGLLMIGATDRGICFLQFGESVQELEGQLASQFPAASREPMPATHAEQFEAWIGALNSYLRGLAPRLDLPLDVRGTAFQLIVWKYLGTIPYGQVQSYSEVAAGIGRPGAARAVARACASNNVAIAIPCHRVVRGTGELGGYRWGIERKRVLLDTERTALGAGRRSG